MSLDIPLIVTAIRHELTTIGIEAKTIALKPFETKGGGVLVTILSSAFDGHTFLDNEMRVRPAVVRAFARQELRPDIILDLLAEDDVDVEYEPSSVNDSDLAPDEERVGRKQWKERLEVVARALDSSNFEREPLVEGKVLVARRSLLSDEKILIGFAQSARASTVDLEVRRQMQTARAAERYGQSYYIVPDRLDNPFANQSVAPWMSIVRVQEFLHILNNSRGIAQRLSEEARTTLAAVAKEHEGPIIEPACKLESKATLSHGFFQYVQDWAQKPGPRLIVLAAPAGHGKTTLTLELARLFADSFVSGQFSQVPLLVPFETVRRTVDFEALLHKRLHQLHGGAPGAFSELLRMNEAVLLVDGFDELADDAGMEAAQAQVRSMRPLMAGNAKVILAGRSAFIQQFAGDGGISGLLKGMLGDVAVETMEIMPFDLEQSFDYIDSRKQLSDDQKANTKAFIRAEPDNQELAGNPLFLRILCSLAIQDLLISKQATAPGVDSLINSVCDREEVRQHLGIGVERQIEFLAELASESFSLGTLSISIGDARVFAEAIAEQVAGVDKPVLVGRLLDHALLTAADDRKLAFIHPFVRDILLGRAVRRELATKKIDSFRQGAIAKKDLPVATIEYLARLGAEFQNAFPDGWLSTPDMMASRARRNLFRLATAAAPYVNPQTPRVWQRPSWSFKNHINSLDMSGLVVESVSFDATWLVGCELERTHFVDCDFMGSTLDGVNMLYSCFEDCRADESFAVIDGRGFVLVLPEGLAKPRSVAPADLQAVLVQDAPVNPTPQPLADVSGACESLLVSVLSEMVELDENQIKFHAVAEVKLHIQRSDNREQMALERIVVPGVVSRMCDVEYGGGSKTYVTLAKQWRPAVLELLQTRRRTIGMEQLIAKMSARAARFLQS